MRKKSDAIDPWMHTIGMLTLLSRLKLAGSKRPDGMRDRPASIGCRHPLPWEYQKGLVTLVDRSNALTATIAWRDSTRCCYGDQVWRAARSRVKGGCAMSGLPINPNDAVFKPCRSRSSPLNAHTMILAAILDDATKP
jgi:hypothetical protein